PLLEGKPTHAKDLEGNIQPAGMGSLATHTDEEVEPNNQSLIQTYGDFQMRMENSNDELNDINDDKDFEAGKEIEEAFPLHDHPESSKAKKHKKFDQSLDPLDSKSSSCFETFKPYDNYMLVIERVLERNLQGFLKVHNAQVIKDNLAKPKEAVASYADLKMEVVGFHDATNRENKNRINGVLTNLKEVQNTIKEDHALNKKVLDVAEAYTKNSSNLIELLTLVKDFDFTSFKSTVESFQATITAQNDSLDKRDESFAFMAWSVGPRMTRIKNS
nr:hypothetical protein [Tanacetum cinerariifolium]